MGTTPPKSRLLCFRCGAACTPDSARDAKGFLLCAMCDGPSKQPAGAIPLAAPDRGPIGRAPCPVCGAAWPAGVSKCPACGHDSEKVPLNSDQARAVLGEFDVDPDVTPEELRRRHKLKRDKAQAKKTAEKPPTCTHCGYLLTGLKADEKGFKCPECGKLSKVFTRSAHDQQRSEETIRAARRRPLIWFLIGLPGCVAMFASKGWLVGGVKGALYGFIGNGPPGGLAGMAANVILGVLTLALAYLCALGVTILCGLMWTGLNTTYRLMAWQLAGLVCLAGFVLLGTLMIPLPIPSYVLLGVACAVYAWGLSDCQDLYYQDATYVTALSCLAFCILGVALRLL